MRLWSACAVRLRSAGDVQLRAATLRAVGAINRGIGLLAWTEGRVKRPHGWIHRGGSGNGAERSGDDGGENGGGNGCPDERCIIAVAALFDSGNQTAVEA